MNRRADDRRGMPKVLGNLLAAAFVVGVLVALEACSPRDDSDDPNGARSGVAPVHDYLTGCEYLRTMWGGITPRMDASGKQVCRKRTTVELPL